MSIPGKRNSFCGWEQKDLTSVGPLAPPNERCYNNIPSPSVEEHCPQVAEASNAAPVQYI